MCTTTTHYETHVSTECSVGGSAQCDGFCEEHGTECTCSCHSGWEDIGQTTDEVRGWHDEQDDVVASFDSLTYGPEQAQAWINARTPDSKEFRVLQGQDRVVVQEYYR